MYKHLSSRLLGSPLAMGTVVTLLLVPSIAAAQVFFGGDVQDGIPAASNIRTGGNSSFRATVLAILFEVLSYMGLAAVVVIVIAGIYMVVGLGSDDSRDRAQKTIIYTLVGLLVIILSSAFVAFLLETANGADV